MATQKVEIELSVKSNAGQAAKDMGSLADNTRKAGQAAGDLNQRLGNGGWRNGTGNGSNGMPASAGWNPSGGAPSGGPVGVPSGAPARRGGGIQGGLGPLARFAGPGALLGTTLSAFHNLSAVDINSQANLGQSAWEVGKGIPLLGSGFRIAEMMGGRGQVDAEIARMVDMTQRNMALNSGRNAIRGDYQSQLRDVELSRIQPRAEAGAAADFQRRLANNPALARSFFTEDKLGVSNAATGAANQAFAEAETGLDSAQRAMMAMQAARDQQAARVAEAEARVRDSRTISLDASRAANQANAAYKNMWVDISGDGKMRAAGATASAGRASDAVAEAETEAQRQRNELVKQENALKQQGDLLARNRLNMAQAELGVMRNRLDVLKQEQNTVKSGAAQFADMSPGEQKALQRALEQLQTSGYGSLSRGQRQRLSGSSLTSDLTRNAAIDFAKDNPLFQQITAAAGLRGIDQSATAISQLQTELANKQAQTTADLSKALADNNDKFAEKMVDLFKKDYDSKIAALEAKIEADNQLRKAQGGKP